MFFQILNGIRAGTLTFEAILVQIIAILFVVFLILPIHEFAHAGAAYLLGDKAIKAVADLPLTL